MVWKPENWELKGRMRFRLLLGQIKSKTSKKRRKQHIINLKFIIACLIPTTNSDFGCLSNTKNSMSARYG